MLELVCGQSAGGSLKMAKNGADFAGDARDVLCPEPVSYTHLDVYKRQALT